MPERVSYVPGIRNVEVYQGQGPGAGYTRPTVKQVLVVLAFVLHPTVKRVLMVLLSLCTASLCSGFLELSLLFLAQQ